MLIIDYYKILKNIDLSSYFPLNKILFYLEKNIYVWKILWDVVGLFVKVDLTGL